MPSVGKRPIIVSNISACGGDRKDALLRTLEGPIPIDAICGDYLAELNLAWLSEQVKQNLDLGYETSFLPQFKLASNAYMRLRSEGRHVKIAVNAGGLRPWQLAKEVRAHLDTYGDEGKIVKVAYITGDNVLHTLQISPQLRSTVYHLTHGTSLDKWGYDMITANVYIGCFGIVTALEQGADIVIAGRCTDASAIQAFGCWWHNWDMTNYDKIALGLVTGHVIECGTYCTGGNYCGFKHVNPYHTLGFPIAEIHGDGFAVITKHPNQNGVVSIETVRSQLLYEIQGRYYYNPDVIADMESVIVEADGKNRVVIKGIKGMPPPETLKLSVLAHGGWQAEINAYAIGLDIVEKGKTWKQMTRLSLGADENPSKFETLSCQTLGRCEPDPDSQDAATATIRIFCAVQRLRNNES